MPSAILYSPTTTVIYSCFCSICQLVAYLTKPTDAATALLYYRWQSKIFIFYQDVIMVSCYKLNLFIMELHPSETYQSNHSIENKMKIQVHSESNHIQPLTKHMTKQLQCLGKWLWHFSNISWLIYIQPVYGHSKDSRLTSVKEKAQRLLLMLFSLLCHEMSLSVRRL